VAARTAEKISFNFVEALGRGLQLHIVSAPRIAKPRTPDLKMVPTPLHAGKNPLARGVRRHLQKY
jgi:hypothetical protein